MVKALESGFEHWPGGVNMMCLGSHGLSPPANCRDSGVRVSHTAEKAILLFASLHNPN